MSTFLTPLPPGNRCFICGATGSGKSTLAAYLATITHQRSARSRLVILDPKRRYFPTGQDGQVPFPEGIGARLVGKRIGVPVNGVLLKGGTPSLLDRRHRIWVVQGYAATVSALAWLYSHADARRPTYVYADETNALLRDNGTAVPIYQLTLSEGREMNVGGIHIHQRPRRISRSMLTEAERVYIGHLRSEDDRSYLQKELGVLVPHLAPFDWLEVDQEHNTSRRFSATL